MIDENVLDQAPGEEVQATDEEQDQLEQAYAIAEEIIHSEGKAGDNIASMVLQAQDITEGLGRATATVLIAVEKKMQISDDMKIALSQEILAELTELAVTAGALAEDEINNDFIDAAVSHAYSEYIKLKEAMGELDPQALQANVSESEQLIGGQQQTPAGRGLLGV